jgi:hypothetical protein
MTTTYLFRIDMAKDNDLFFAAMRPSASLVYAGVDFRAGAGAWIPDLLRIAVEQPTGRCSLTLIELEATETVAMVSCRKYLPENSADILKAFNDYLDRVIRQCRSTADSRESEFAQLKAMLSDTSHVTVTTAGALRSSTTFVEELLLIDQPRVTGTRRAVQENLQQSQRIFRGIIRLGRLEAEAMSRCVMILDAVIRRCDHSNTRFEIWRKGRKNSPVKFLLEQSNGSNPVLRSVVLESKIAGLTMDFAQMLSELVEIWSVVRERQLDVENVRGVVSRYFHIATAIKGHEQMVGIFETARKQVAEVAI